MAEDLQGLLEKINREGVEKAEAAAAAITAEAGAKAAAIVREAEEKAAAAKESARLAAETYENGAKERIRQAARDLVLEVKASIEKTLEKLLLEDVEKAMSDEAVAVPMAAKAAAEIAGGMELTAPEKLAAALKARFASRPEVSISVSGASRSGFTVKTDGGRVELDFTAKAIADELARRLRPDLAALLK
ncbi:MAG: hypothetical protein IIT98_02320 [Kiritimatiellae bacterium]|nr:hypothetical protein [Kiritimatiellia bacterium]